MIKKLKTCFFLVAVIILLLLLPSCGGGEKIKPHILLVTIDTLRRDHVGIYGYPRNTSPFLDELAREGLRFEHVITPVPLTAPSHASILTSLHPITHQLTFNGGQLNSEVQTLAEALKKNGYYTIGTTAVKLLSTKYGFSRGFDSFSDTWKLKKGFDTAYERTAPSVNRSVIRQVEEYLANPGNKDKPLFIWVHYFDPHWPYHEWDHISFKNKLPKDEHREPMKRHDKEIHYTDEHIRMLHDFLVEKDLAKHLVTCITADHGEQFGDHGYANCHVEFYSENTFVPLVFYGYRIPKHKVIDTYVSTMDIAATLLARANASFAYHTEGIDLFKVVKKPANYRDRKFLIVGNPASTRSLQLLGYPYDLILNFDHHYRDWYILTDLDNPGFRIEASRFKLVPANQIEPVKKQKAYRVTLPANLEKGLQYAVLQADVQSGQSLSVRVHLPPSVFTKGVRLDPGIKQFTILFPVAIADRIAVVIKNNKDIPLQNLRYTFIPEEELPAAAVTGQKRKNEIFNQLITRRKNSKEDEFYLLSQDLGMEKNRVREEQFMPVIIKFKKLIYAAFDYYYKKGNQILKGMKTKELTGEDKKMLKTLGYL
jgi:arylsulfatase A-like enzyme